ncbi:DUF2285 domain-containing protein [Brucella anthropi]|uniref:DUF2285 domain-containing protein n=1 Tax=Brucella anthropi TaxID=529 RepID=UPI001F441A50|nr:DUF2285 domain-containing protein [Brucella anthropi]
MWLPQDDTSAIAFSEAPAAYRTNAETYPRIDDTLLSEASSESALLYDLADGQRIQLWRDTADRSGRPLAALVPLDLEGFDRLQSVARLLASLHGRAIPPDTRLTRHQRARFRRMLQSFDGYRDGATQQEIAQIVFRTGALDRDTWQASSARHAIKSLLRDARSMISGGYRLLLRHRRQV